MRVASWVTGRPTALPVGNARQRRAWSAFVRAAAERYGTRGAFWRGHAPGSDDDALGHCDFCDSTGLFRRGPRFKPKPAWHRMAAIARGRLR